MISTGTFSLFVFVNLISTVRGVAQLIGSTVPILGIVGEVAILPCRVQPAESVSEETVEWSRSDLDHIYVFKFLHGREDYKDQNKSFRQRAKLFLNELKDGNMSLQLGPLKLSDSGNYTCKLIKAGIPISTHVHLVMGAVSPPVISGVRDKNRTVVLKCEAKKWFPEPEMEWRDKEGKMISHDFNTTGHDEYFSISGEIKVETTDNIYTCIVRQQNINKSREISQEIYGKSVDLKNSMSALDGLLGLSIMLIITLIVGIMAYYLGMKSPCEGQKTCSVYSTHSTEGQDDPDGIPMVTSQLNKKAPPELEQLQREKMELENEVSDLKAKLQQAQEDKVQLQDQIGKLQAELEQLQQETVELKDHL